MRLYLLRHGAAEERREGMGDYDRRLTIPGIAEMERVAIGLKMLVGEIDLILSSPLPRALETARIAATALGVASERLVVSDHLSAGRFDKKSLQSLSHSLAAGHRVMAVGHEPDLSGLVRELTGATIEMKKAGLAFIETYGAENDSGI